MWNDITMLIRSVYPALLLLRLADFEEQEQEDLDDSDSDDETIDEEKPEVTLGERVKLRWDHRKKKLIHDLSIAAWMLSPVPDIMSDAYSSHDGEHRNAVERILKRWILDEEVNLFAVLTYIFVQLSNIFL